MDITIGAYNAQARTVPVVFSTPGNTYPRDVFAELTPDGEYDEARTAARVAAMEAGMVTKIANGSLRSNEELEAHNAEVFGE